MVVLKPVATDDDQPRSRRSRHEVHRLILDAARTLFSEKGYAGTSTREIAERAGVHEPMVYRRFASKAKLFEAAVLVPFEEVISTYLSTWEAQVDAPASLEDLVRAFVEPLYALLAEHHELTLALVASQGFPTDAPDGEDNPEPPILRLLDRMEPQLNVEGARRGLRVSSPQTVLVTVGMVAGMALFDQTFLSSRPGWVSRRQLIEEMVQMILRGVGPREQDRDAGAPASGRSSAGQPADLSMALVDRLVDAERRAARAELELERLRRDPAD